MRSYEEQYINILENIFYYGYSDGTNERTGKATKRLPMQTICVDVNNEFPILRTKQVFAKTAEREILWIWQAMSNNINDLQAHIWDEWADETGSIGTAYGYQMRHPVRINEGSWDKPIYREYPSQAAFVLDYLKEYPNGRHAHTTLWKVDELDQMHLVPCVHSTDWNLDGGRLNLNLTQRSGDMAYGVPFNTTQYAMLMHMFARHLGVKPGILLHTISDAHIYDTQMDGVEQQLTRWKMVESMRRGLTEDEKHSYAKLLGDGIIEEAEKAFMSIPEFSIDEGVDSFWDMTVDNARVINYKSLPRLDFGDIAV